MTVSSDSSSRTTFLSLLLAPILGPARATDSDESYPGQSCADVRCGLQEFHIALRRTDPSDHATQQFITVDKERSSEPLLIAGGRVEKPHVNPALWGNDLVRADRYAAIALFLGCDTSHLHFRTAPRSR